LARRHRRLSLVFAPAMLILAPPGSPSAWKLSVAQKQKSRSTRAAAALTIGTEIFYGINSLRPRNSGQQTKHIQKAAAATVIEVTDASSGSGASLKFITLALYNSETMPVNRNILMAS
jgi:hypothetical protein